MSHEYNKLKQRLKSIVTSLKQKSCHLHFVTGIAGSGKSALFSQSDYVRNQLLTESGEEINLWINDNNLFIELAHSFYDKPKREFRDLIYKITHCHRSVHTAGIITCVNVMKLSELLKDNTQNHEKFFKQAKKVSLALNQRTRHHVILTHCDVLAGFCEYYEQEHESELEKPLGFDLRAIANKELIIKQAQEKFFHLLEELNNQVIKKLHNTRNTLKKCLIREYPLKFERLLELIEIIIDESHSPRMPISTIFFTSAKQGGKNVDSINESVERTFSLVVSDMMHANNERKYFIKGCLNTITSKQPFKFKPKINRRHIAGFIGVTAAISLIISYQHIKANKAINDASKALARYQLLSSDPNLLNDTISQLSQATQALSNAPSTLGFSSLTRLRKSIDKKINKQLHQGYLPRIAIELEEYLENTNLSPVQRYQALKAYKMLGSSQHMEASYVIAWFKDKWRSLSEQEQTKHVQLLQKALLQPYTAIELNEVLIRNNVNLLSAIDTDYLYYQVIKQHLPQKTIAINIQGYHLAYQQIPVYFLKKNYTKTKQQIAQHLNTLKHDSWVLNKGHTSNITSTVMSAYETDYVNWWQRLLQKTSAVNFNDYQQAKIVLGKIAKPNKNALTTLIKLLQNNTAPLTNDEDFNASIASQFTAINLFPNSNLTSIEENLTQLQHYFATLSMAKDSDQIAFEIARNRFQYQSANDPITKLYDIANQMPRALAPWLENIANNAWYIVINDARGHINRQWKNIVFEFYLHKLKDRYPFAPNDDEVGISEFTEFFADSGIFNKFFNTYLSPFLDKEKAQWKPQQKNGFFMPIKQQVLNELMSANVIHEIFFGKNPNHIDIQFSLKKLQLDPIVSKFKIQFGETDIEDKQSTDKAITFHWPSNDAKIDLVSISGEHFELTEKGEWALFKMLDNFQIDNDKNNNTRFQVMFDINGNAALYLLQAETQLNPFIPGLLKSFKLDRKLI